MILIAGDIASLLIERINAVQSKNSFESLYKGGAYRRPIYAREPQMKMSAEPSRKLVSQLTSTSDAVFSIAPSESAVKSTPISVSFGDGTGPTIMEATLRLMQVAGADIRVQQIELGGSPIRSDKREAIIGDAFESIKATRVLLKSSSFEQAQETRPLEKLLNKELGLFASVRPCTAYGPFVRTKQPNANVVIIKQNDEDLYSGIEYRQTDEVYESLRILSRFGCQRAIKVAFDFAAQTGRQKVSCFSNQNALKFSDGLFCEVFEAVAADYPDIETEQCAVDSDAALLFDDPSRFDVIVVPNMPGTLLSAAMARMASPMACAHYANLGTDHSMFAVGNLVERPVDNDAANPSGLMLASVMMLLRIGQFEVAELIHNAWLRTIEDGFHTADMFFSDGRSKRLVGTVAFTDCVVANLGETPSHLKPVSYDSGLFQTVTRELAAHPKPPARKKLVGVDVFVHWRGIQSRALAETMRCALDENLELTMITARDGKVWPIAPSNLQKTDHWRCRYRARPGRSIVHTDIAELQSRLAYLGIDFIKTDHLYEFDGKPGFIRELDT